MRQVAQAREKGLEELLDAVRGALGESPSQLDGAPATARGGGGGSGGDGEVVAERLEARLVHLQSPDDLVDLCSYLRALLSPPDPTLTAAAAGGDAGLARPLHMTPDSLFGIFLRKFLSDCDSQHFGRLSTLFDQVSAYTARTPALDASFAVGARATHAHSATVGAHQSAVRHTADVRGGAEMPSGWSDVSGIANESARYARRAGTRLRSVSSIGLDGDDMDVTSGSMDAYDSAADSAARPAPHTHRLQRYSPYPRTSNGGGGGATPFLASVGSRASRAERSVAGPARGPGGAPVDASVLSVNQVQMYLQGLAQGVEEGPEWRRDAPSVDAEVQSFLDVHPDLPRAHFYLHLRRVRARSCLNMKQSRQYLQERELAGTVHALHRYFDYATRRGGPAAKPDSASAQQRLLHALALYLNRCRYHAQRPCRLNVALQLPLVPLVSASSNLNCACKPQTVPSLPRAASRRRATTIFIALHLLLCAVSWRRAVRGVLPYAVLRLAAVHSGLGQSEMATAALRETLRIAQARGAAPKSPI
ncbi:hypothetical protein JKP88DRAFT_240712 [Tribonema minus]|uniref:Anaphase-promoting complex subunit 5 n=1 Tax=Tribonema minus TaxID=303371 RepID=A0A835ZG47_9STRA|nr:hypothetical protein JKP88DRAFT_240712 [Tribonema minus]